MSKRIKKAPTAIGASTFSTSNTKSYTKHILKKFDENVKFNYELIDIFEQAKEVSKQRLLCMIDEVQSEIGKAYIVERLTAILNERFKYV